MSNNSQSKKYTNYNESLSSDKVNDRINRKNRNKHNININKDFFMLISVALSSILNIGYILPFWGRLGYSRNLFICTIFITLTAFFIYMISNVVFLNEDIKIHANKFILIYILFLISITFFKTRLNTMSFVFDPLNSVWSLKYSLIPSLVNILGNLLMYIPIGMYIRYKLNSSIAILIVSFLIYILLVEFIQGITKTGVFDMNDVVTNTLGFIIGMKIAPKK